MGGHTWSVKSLKFHLGQLKLHLSDMVKMYSSLLEPTSEDDFQTILKDLRGATSEFYDCVILEKRMKSHLKSVHMLRSFTSYSLSHAPTISAPSHPTSLPLNSGCSRSQIDLSASVTRCQSTSVPRRGVGVGKEERMEKADCPNKRRGSVDRK